MATLAGCGAAMLPFYGCCSFWERNQFMSNLKTLLVLAAAGLMLTLSGCNTVEGVGKDVKSAGKTLEDAAK